ncbi:MAG: selenocysteine-specific translation elongation factor, partial [Pseudomonadota bacterium]
MIVATAGHVDHGKTSLVQQLTGIDTDRLAEEKARGLTIDLGFAYTEADGETLGFIDVPGHIRFIHNMLAGVSIVDMALLVIAADDGPMPQTIEHLAILDLLGINKVITVITKIDRVSDERIAAVHQEVQTVLVRTSLSGCPIVTASSETGEGIDTIKQQLVSASSASTDRNETGYFRLAIDRSFNVKGSGTVVTGSVFAGATQVGDQLKLMPAGTTVRVRGLHRQNKQSQSTVAGDRCALNLSGNL